jgi:zinc transporter, ZIP family
MPVENVSLFFSSSALFFSTLLGVTPLLVLRNLSEKHRSLTEGFCAGAMLAASFFSLLLPGLNQSQYSLFSINAGVLSIAFFILGYFSMSLLHELLPHTHEEMGTEGRGRQNLRKIWLVFFAIAIHNIPEGFAVGVGLVQGGAEGNALLAAICLQNFPEGFIIAAALLTAGETFYRAIKLTFAAAFIELSSCIFGFFAFQHLEKALPWALVFAAGAMIFVVCREMIPESQKRYPSNGSFGIILGIAVILLLRNYLGA